MPFNLEISPGSPSPIFRQIVEQVRMGVMTGTLSEGEQLPSVRSLAERLLVNPNTVARAYGELMRDGLIDGQQGRGVFIARQRQIYTKAERQRRIAPLIDALVNEGLWLGFTQEEIIEAVSEKMEKLAPAETAQEENIMSNNVIATTRLTRYFGKKCAVDQVNLTVPRGSVFAFLGRNGSGKSTLVRMILGLLEPTRGSSNVLDEDSQQLSPPTRGRIAYVAEGHPLIDWMRVEQLEDFQKSFYPNWDGHIFAKVVEHFDLDRKSKAGNLSRGQRAGLSLALALAGRPELLIMDDPALGLDPVARRTLLETMILVTRDAGNTIFFTSHILDDVERVADHIAILDRSVLRVCCPVEVFHSRVRRLTLEFAGQPPSVANVPGILEAQRQSGQLQLTIANYGAETEKLLAGLGAISISESPLTLEDAVIAYLGRRGEQTSLLRSIGNPELTK